MEQIELERDVARVSWKGLWAGLFVVAAVEILMQLFGFAIGISAMRPTAGAMRGVGIWNLIWTIISILSSFFFGGWAAAAFSAPLRRSGGVLLGLALWAFATTIGVFVLASSSFGPLGIARALMTMSGGDNANQLRSGYTIGTAWATFGTLLVALVCAIAGGLVGSHDFGRRRRIERTTVVPPPVTTPPVNA